MAAVWLIDMRYSDWCASRKARQNHRRTRRGPVIKALDHNSKLKGVPYLAGAPHAIVCDLNFLALRHILCKLIQVRGTREIQNNLLRDLSEALIQLIEVIRLHSLETEDIVSPVCRTWI